MMIIYSKDDMHDALHNDAVHWEQLEELSRMTSAQFSDWCDRTIEGLEFKGNAVHPDASLSSEEREALFQELLDEMHN